MSQHAFKASTGARFSKHLGTRYGYNRETANTIWYTDAHEKLYLKNLHMYSIYYHVTNQKQNLQGWIWKGYLKPTSINPKGSTSTNNSGKVNFNNTHQSISSRVQDVLSLFPGTKYSQSASEYLDTDSEDIVQNPDPRSAAQKQDSVTITHSTTLELAFRQFNNSKPIRLLLNNTLLMISRNRI